MGSKGIIHFGPRHCLDVTTFGPLSQTVRGIGEGGSSRNKIMDIVPFVQVARNLQGSSRRDSCVVTGWPDESDEWIDRKPDEAWTVVIRTESSYLLR